MATSTLTRTLTHSQLLAEITAGTLHKGESITISDYRTVHTIPNTADTNTGDLEPLLVTAISNNELKPEAYSVAFPDDIIYYCPDNDQSRVAGCTKGYIYRRIDTIQNNDIPFDFRNVKFRRWQIDQPTWDIATTYPKYAVVKSTVNDTLWVSLHDGNIGIDAGSDNTHWRQFEWDNMSYMAWLPTDFIIGYNGIVVISLTTTINYMDYKIFADGYELTIFSNKINSPSSYDDLIENNNSIIFGGSIIVNNIGSNFTNNTINNYFAWNNIGYGFNGNSVGQEFQNNKCDIYFENNSIGNYFNYNVTGVNFQYNSVGQFSSNNFINNNFISNNISEGFNSNIINAEFNSNNINVSFSLNKIYVLFKANNVGTTFTRCIINGGNFTNNTIVNNFRYNIIMSAIIYTNFTTATHVYATYTCQIFKGQSGNKLSYCDSSDVITIVNVNA